MRVRDKKYIILAEQQAAKSDMKQKLGCVLVDNKKVINTGYNKCTGFNNFSYNFFIAAGSMHAEVATLKNYMKYEGKLTLYVARSQFRNSKPCPHCLDLIRKTNVKRIVFTTTGDILEEMFL